MAGVASEWRHLDRGGVLERRLGKGALLKAFLATKVSMKFDLIVRATEDKVAQRQQEALVGKGEPVRAADDIKRSALGAPLLLSFLCTHRREMDVEMWAVPELPTWKWCRILGLTTISCSC
jgi:hypothetical protein